MTETHTAAAMQSAFGEVLALCGVGPGEKVAVLSEGALAQDYSEAFLRAASGLGGEALRVNVAASGNAGAIFSTGNPNTHQRRAGVGHDTADIGKINVN